MTYYNVAITCSKEEADTIESEFTTLGAESVSHIIKESQLELIALTQNPTLFTTHFPNATITPVENWEHKWLDYYEDTQLTADVRVTTTPLSQETKNTIYLNPKDAFGDGRHPTTRLCAKALTQLPTLGRGIDIGTGTGILAILSEKLGATHIDACDIDPASVEKAHYNSTQNHCTKINVFEADILSYHPTQHYDCVIANILTTIIEHSIDTIIQLCQPNGTLIFSGISTQWKEDMTAFFIQHGLSIDTCKELDGWCCFVVRRATSKLRN